VNRAKTKGVFEKWSTVSHSSSRMSLRDQHRVFQRAGEKERSTGRRKGKGRGAGGSRKGVPTTLSPPEAWLIGVVLGGNRGSKTPPHQTLHPPPIFHHLDAIAKGNAMPHGRKRSGGPCATSTCRRGPASLASTCMFADHAPSRGMDGLTLFEPAGGKAREGRRPGYTPSWTEGRCRRKVYSKKEVKCQPGEGKSYLHNIRPLHYNVARTIGGDRKDSREGGETGGGGEKGRRKGREEVAVIPLLLRAKGSSGVETGSAETHRGKKWRSRLAKLFLPRNHTLLLSCVHVWGRKGKRVIKKKRIGGEAVTRTASRAPRLQ